MSADTDVLGTHGAERVRLGHKHAIWRNDTLADRVGQAPGLLSRSDLALLDSELPQALEPPNLGVIPVPADER